MDTPKKQWFKAKNYGWGWYPASVEGWFILLVYVLLFTGSLILFMEFLPQYSENAVLIMVPFLLWVVLLTSGLLWICYKTGEKPEWRWGAPKK
jgi:hypothetical protein